MSCCRNHCRHVGVIAVDGFLSRCAVKKNQCPLRGISGPLTHPPGTSAFGSKADIIRYGSKGPLIAKSERSSNSSIPDKLVRGGRLSLQHQPKARDERGREGVAGRVGHRLYMLDSASTWPRQLGNRPFHGRFKHTEAGKFGRASSGSVVPETRISPPPEKVGRMIVAPAGFDAGPPWANRSRHRESPRPL